jgi:hypothetical protein
MKIGKEVEGKYRGTTTLLCHVSELSTVLSNIFSLPKHGIEHIYISDHDNVLSEKDYDNLSNVPYQVTVETKAFPDQTRYPNISYMLAVELDPKALGFFSSILYERDQVKFTANLFVATASMFDFNTTDPTEFEADIVVDEAYLNA